MIKLKSLFRRGQGPSGSSKHSANFSSPLQTSASTSSLNSIGTSTPSTSPVATTLSKSSLQSSAFYDSHDSLDSRDTTPESPYQTTKSLCTTGRTHSQSSNNIQVMPKGQHNTNVASSNSSNSLFIDTKDITNEAAAAAANKPYHLSLQDLSRDDNNLIECKPENEIVGATTIKTNATAGLAANATTIKAASSTAATEVITNREHLQQQQQQQHQQQQVVINKLEQELQQMQREKLALEAKVVELSSYKNEVITLLNEISKLKETTSNEIQQLVEENESLRSRLRDVVHSPLSDAEKQQIIDDSQRMHSSAPPSIVPANNDVSITTPDWDKHSSGSEVSVACLQDKLIQMEETHYSTSEELQATLQELADLQNQLVAVQSDNDRLSEEKDVLFQSLCRQTEKLEDSRSKIGKLQELLLRDSGELDTVLSSQYEKNLLELLNNAQEERESLLNKQKELHDEIKDLRTALEQSVNEKSNLHSRVNMLNSALTDSKLERNQTDNQTADVHSVDGNAITSSGSYDMQLKAVSENDRGRMPNEKELCDLRDLVEAMRKEKAVLDGAVTKLQDSLTKSQCEVQMLKEQIVALNDEYKLSRNTAKGAMSDLEYKYEQLKQEKMKLSVELQMSQDTVNELHMQGKCHRDDKSQLENCLTENQRHICDLKRRLAEKEDQLNNEKKLRKFENEEWKQFQSDLLMTVRVANDFKAEAQVTQEQTLLENKTQKNKIRTLEQEIIKLTKALEEQEKTTLLNSVQQEMAMRVQRACISRQDSRISVKSLIESIEKSQQNVKSKEEGNSSTSRYSSTSSLNSLLNDAHISQCTRNQIGEWQDQLHASLSQRSPMEKSENFSVDGNQNIKKNIGNSSEQSAMDTSQKFGVLERKDPLNALVKNGGSKRNALLKWCQIKTVGYPNIDITNFSSSWNDGLALCALMHCYLPQLIPYETLGPHDKRRNFSIVFAAAESVGIHTTLNINTMCQQERPDWQQVLAYVTSIYKHFET